MAPRKRAPNLTDVFVGQRVRMARLMAKMSQEKLAEPLGLTFQQVQKYEKGVNRIGSSRMQQISNILGKPVSWFFDEKGDNKSPDVNTCSRLVSSANGVRLAETFLSIKNPATRTAAVDVVRALATAG